MPPTCRVSLVLPQGRVRAPKGVCVPPKGVCVPLTSPLGQVVRDVGWRPCPLPPTPGSMPLGPCPTIAQRATRAARMPPNGLHGHSEWSSMAAWQKAVFRATWSGIPFKMPPTYWV
jgi:hypothetical protein